jgi:hypothetical protein
MCHFMFLDGMEGRWVLMGVVVKLAQSVGNFLFSPSRLVIESLGRPA